MDKTFKPAFIKSMEQQIDANLLEKARVVRDKYKNDGVLILGLLESPKESLMPVKTDLDVFYELDPKTFEKFPGNKFFELFKKIQKELENALGLTVDLVDSSSLGAIGQEDILKKVHYIMD